MNERTGYAEDENGASVEIAFEVITEDCGAYVEQTDLVITDGGISTVYSAGDEVPEKYKALYEEAEKDALG